MRFHDFIKNWTDNARVGREGNVFLRYSAYILPDVMDIEYLNVQPKLHI